MNKKYLIWIVILLFCLTTVQAVLTDNLIAGYNHDDNATDVLGLTNGTATGTPEVITGKVGQAYHFTSDGMYNQLPSTTIFDFGTNNFTYSVWVNVTDKSVTKSILSRFVAGNSFHNFRILDTDDVQISMYITGGSKTCTVSTGDLSGSLFDGAWHHLVVRRISNGACAGTFELYIDNVNQSLTVDSSAGTGAGIYASMGDVRIGNDAVDNTAEFKGGIDMFYIWNRSLTVSEINDLYNSGSGSAYPFPAAPAGFSESVNQTYDLTASEKSIVFFNLTMNFNSSNANFTYNSITYNTARFYDGATNVTTFRVNVTTPLIPSNNTQYSYNWSYVNSTGQVKTTSTSLQGIYFNVTLNSWFMDNAIETQTQKIGFNLSYNSLITVSNTTVVYDSTPLSASLSSGYFYTDLFYTPLISADWNTTINVNATFYVNDSTTTYLRGVNKTLLVYRLKTYNCTTPGSIRFVLKNEETDSNLTSNMEGVFTTWLNVSSNFRNDSISKTGSHTYPICIYPDNISRFANALIDYSATGFSTREYYLYNYSMSNVTDTIYLYLLNSSSSSNVYFTLMDENSNKVNDYYLKIQRYDPGTNIYSTVTIVKTDSNGEAMARLVLYDVWYKILVQASDGTTVKVEGPFKVSRTEYTIYINLLANFLDVLEESLDVTSSLSYVESGNYFKYVYSDSNNVVRTGCLDVIRRSVYGDTIICKSCSDTTSATITCPLTGVNGTYLATGLINNGSSDMYILQSLERNTANNDAIFGKEGLFISFFIIGLIACVGLWHPAAAVFMALLALIGSVIIGFVTLSYTSIIVLVIFGVIILVKAKR